VSPRLISVDSGALHTFQEVVQTAVSGYFELNADDSIFCSDYCISKGYGGLASQLEHESECFSSLVRSLYESCPGESAPPFPCVSSKG